MSITYQFSALLGMLLFMTSSVVDARHSCAEVIKKGNYANALSICSEESKQKKGQDIEVLLSLVEINHELGNEEQEAYFLAKIKTHPHFLENIAYQYQWNRRVGQKYYFLGNYQQAQKYLHKGLEIAKAEAQESWQSKSFNDAALVAYKLKNHLIALNHFKQSLELKRVHGNTYQVGKTLNNIALVHMDLEKHTLAIDYYEQALDQYLKYVDQADFDERVFQKISHIYEDLTQAYTVSNDVVAAKDYAAKIVSTFKLKNSPKARARALMNLGKHHSGLEQYSSAKVFFDEAKLIYLQHNYDFEPSHYLDTATVEFHAGETAVATTLAKKGLAAAQISHDHRLISRFYALLSDMAAANDPAKALQFMKLHQSSREQFLQNKYDSDLNNVQHEVEKQQIKHDLINEQLLVAQKSAALQRMTNVVLMVIMISLLIIGIFIAYMVNKRRERRELLKSIKHHEQQLFMMQDQKLSLQESEHHQHHDVSKQTLKVQLVSTMIDALSIWEKTTGKDRIELAERSKVWTISIDNGTLRTRSLDKYLDVDKIPQNPRWRNVVKTCHFILSQEDLPADDRAYMEDKLNSLLEQIKQLSLGIAA